MAWRPSSEWLRGDPSVPNLMAGAGGRSSSEPVRVAAAGYVVHGMPPGRFREHTSRRPAAVVALKQRSSRKGGEGCFPPCAAATVFRSGD
uniref:Uncharacterized protein n=1 Tax=Oryza barthii TaxID=65489 RepID=A0A0D3HUJ0_9ORYZ